MTAARLLRSLGRGLARAAWFVAFLAARASQGGRRRGPRWRFVYARYMRSASWRRCRQRAAARSGDRCGRLACNAGGSLDCHHRHYWLAGWDPWWCVVSICRDCHEKTHGRTIPRRTRRATHVHR